MTDNLSSRLEEAARIASDIRAAGAARNGRKVKEITPPSTAKSTEAAVKRTVELPEGELTAPVVKFMEDIERLLRDDVMEVIDEAYGHFDSQTARVEKSEQFLKNMVSDVEKSAITVSSLAKELRQLIKDNKPTQYVIQQEAETTELGVLEGVSHYKFDQLVQACAVRGYGGHRKNILLKGPAGSGKSTAGVRLAKLMDLPFTYIGQTLMPHTIEGYVRQGDGVFQTTPFIETFEKGGVLMLEEVDGWSPQAVLVANPPLANGHMVLPDGRMIERHKDCIIIACANTWGTGATAEYVGRNKLDAAFLDRFGIRIDWGYDDRLERAAARNDDLVTKVQTARVNADRAGIKVIISPRASIDCADMVRGGFSERAAFEVNFLSSLDRNQRKTVLAGIVFDD